MVDRRAEDAAAFVERSTELIDHGQTQGRGCHRSRRQCQAGPAPVHGQERAMQEKALDAVLGQSRELMEGLCIHQDQPCESWHTGVEGEGHRVDG
jgi:hypothetical protein